MAQFQKGGQKRQSRMKKGKIPQACRILVSPVNGSVSFQAPFNEDFNKEFLAAVDQKRRLWDPERKLWKAVPELLNVIVDIAQKHYAKVEGLTDIYKNDYDVIGVSADLSMTVIRATVKALRIDFAPDHAPDGMQEEYTDRIQEISEAFARIEAERGDE